ESLAKLRRAIRQMAVASCPSPLQHIFHTFLRNHGSNENGGGKVLFLRYKIQHPVHPVGEVDIGMARRPPDRSVAPSPACPRVAPQIFGSNIPFCFHDQSRHSASVLQATDQSLAEKLPCYRE